MTKCVLSCIVVAFVTTHFRQEALARRWTDHAGRGLAEAELIDFADDTAILRTRDGSIKNVPLKQLSEADQQYLRNFSRQPWLKKYDRDNPPDLSMTITTKDGRTARIDDGGLGSVARMQPAGDFGLAGGMFVGKLGFPALYGRFDMWIDGVFIQRVKRDGDWLIATLNDGTAAKYRASEAIKRPGVLMLSVAHKKSEVFILHGPAKVRKKADLVSSISFHHKTPHVGHAGRIRWLVEDDSGKIVLARALRFRHMSIPVSQPIQSYTTKVPELGIPLGSVRSLSVSAAGNEPRRIRLDVALRNGERKAVSVDPQLGKIGQPDLVGEGRYGEFAIPLAHVKRVLQLGGRAPAPPVP